MFEVQDNPYFKLFHHTSYELLLILSVPTRIFKKLIDFSTFLPHDEFLFYFKAILVAAYFVCNTVHLSSHGIAQISQALLSSYTAYSCALNLLLLLFHFLTHSMFPRILILKNRYVIFSRKDNWWMHKPISFLKPKDSSWICSRVFFFKFYGSYCVGFFFFLVFVLLSLEQLYFSDLARCKLQCRCEHSRWLWSYILQICSKSTVRKWRGWFFSLLLWEECFLPYFYSVPLIFLEAFSIAVLCGYIFNNPLNYSTPRENILQWVYIYTSWDKSVANLYAHCG